MAGGSKGGLLKKIGIAIVAILVIGAVFGRRAGRSGSGDTIDTPVAITQEQQSEQTASQEEAESESKPEVSAAECDETQIRPEFKEAMDSYEAFFSEYVECAKAIKSDATNAELLLRLSELTAQEADMMRDFEAWESESLSTAETAYYLEVHSRITAKLAEIV